MTITQLRAVLAANPAAGVHFMLPDGDFVPPHFHVTEVGRVDKRFIDCGGATRSASHCALQLWVADDADHRLDTSKLAKIVALAGPLLGGGGELPVEVEYDPGVLGQYPLTAAEATPSGVLFHLGGKHAACLAPDRCGVGAAGCC